MGSKDKCKNSIQFYKVSSIVSACVVGEPLILHGSLDSDDLYQIYIFEEFWVICVTWDSFIVPYSQTPASHFHRYLYLLCSLCLMCDGLYLMISQQAAGLVGTHASCLL